MICFITRDQGGTEYLYEYSKSISEKKVFIASGPAVSFLKSKNNIKFITFKQLSKIKIDKIVTSTSYLNSFHIKGILYAKKKNINCSSIIDDWNEYKRRFTFKKKLVLPDELIVFNKPAYAIAKSNFPKIKIILLKDFFLKKILDEIKIYKKKFVNKTAKKRTFDKILYLSDPIEFNVFTMRERTEYNEKNVINFICKNIYKISKKFKINIRMHPSYNHKQSFIRKLFFKNNIKVKISKEKSLLKDIMRNDIILGCETHALIPAFYSKKNVYCVIPDYVKKENKIKHLKIKELRKI
jgi:hypothetical protein